MDTVLEKLDLLWKTLRRSDQRHLAGGRKKLIDCIKNDRTAEEAEEIKKILKRKEAKFRKKKGHF